jgi:hypothetical protein
MEETFYVPRRRLVRAVRVSSANLEEIARELAGLEVYRHEDLHKTTCLVFRDRHGRTHHAMPGQILLWDAEGMWTSSPEDFERDYVPLSSDDVSWSSTTEHSRTIAGYILGETRTE